MFRSCRPIVSLVVALALVWIVCGCQKSAEKPPAGMPQGGPLGMPPGGPGGPDGPGGPGGPGGGGGFGPPSQMRMNMVQMFGRGPKALKNSLDGELKSDSLSWDTVQSQTAELVKLTGQVAKADPPKGEKDSWARLAGALEVSAKDLDKAAQAKDQKAAAAALEKINQSCKNCHDVHKPAGGPGGFRGPGGGFGPPGKGPGGSGKTP